jgi:hypothetical protein
MSGKDDMPAAPEVAPTPELQAIIKIGERYITLQESELDLKKTEIEANTRIALASIEAQREAVTHDHNAEGSQQKSKFQYATLIIAIVMATIIALVWLGAKDLVSDIVKVALGFAGGILGGYQWGKNKALTSDDDDDE